MPYQVDQDASREQGFQTQGWGFVPLKSGKSAKQPIGKDWQDRPFRWNDLPPIGSKYDGFTVGGYGLIFGPHSDGVVGLDFDGEAAWKMVADWGIELPPTIHITSGRPGRGTLLYKVPEQYWEKLQTRKIPTGKRGSDEWDSDYVQWLEIRWKGAQSVIQGIHPDTKKPYQIINWVDPLPDLPEPLLQKWLELCSENGKPRDPKPQKLSAPHPHKFSDSDSAKIYLDNIDPSVLDWYEWRNCLFGAHHAGLSEGEVLDWSRRSSKHTDKGFSEVWRHIKGSENGITVGTLGMYAKQQGWHPERNGSDYPKTTNGRIPPPQESTDPDLAGDPDQDVELLAEVEELSQLDQGSGLSLLPASLETPLKRLAGRMNLPLEAYYLTLLCTAASQVSNGIRLELDRGTDYNVPPILWGGIVGETGSRKTPIINAITSPLDALQTELEQIYRTKLEAYQAEQREFEKSRKEDKGDPPVEPKPTDLYVSDFTLEALCQVLGNQPDRGLLVSQDELTTFFKSMDAYRNGRGSDRARWLEFYNARALKVDRKTTGRVYVPRTSISLIGGIQPSVIRGLWEQDKTGEDGLWARFAWVRIPITTSTGIQEGATYDLSELLKSLYCILGTLSNKTYRLDRHGIQTWNDWHHETDQQILAEPSDILRASLPKTKDRAARIALILHLIEAAAEGNRDPDAIIPAATLTKAISFARWLQGQTRLLYGELGVVDNPEAARILRFVNRFRDCKVVEPKQVRGWWSSKEKPSMKDIRAFMERIVSLGYATKTQEDRFRITITEKRSHVVTPAPQNHVSQGFDTVTTVSQPLVTLVTPNPRDPIPQGFAGVTNPNQAMNGVVTPGSPMEQGDVTTNVTKGDYNVTTQLVTPETQSPQAFAAKGDYVTTDLDEWEVIAE